MPLSKEQLTALDKTCAPGDDKKILSYLKAQIQSKQLTPEDVLEYTEYYFEEEEEEEEEKCYALSPSVINQFGVFISKQRKAIKAKFYKLAADRNHSYGCENYAKCLLNKKQYAEALPFARKAVELTRETSSEQHKHKGTLWRLLIENHLYDDCYQILKDHMESISEKEAEVFYRNHINTLEKEVSSVSDNPDHHHQPPQTLSINQLIQLIDDSQRLRSEIHLGIFSDLKQELYFLQGQYAEKLGKTEDAWQSYSSICDKSTRYPLAITAKVRLLKEKIRGLLNPLPALEKLTISEEPTVDLEIPLPISLAKACKKEASWFDSINVTEIETLSLDQQAAIKKEREKSHKKNGLGISIKDELDSIEEKLEEKIATHSPSYRKIYRRHATEKHFFNPQRTKKKEALIALTDRIIEQRYRINTDPTPDPVTLDEKSSRLFITAERLYQEAIIALNGEHFSNLGIPKIREKPWEINGHIGATGYGPRERYQVGESITTAEHRTNPKRERLGDSFLPEYGAYTKHIYQTLKLLCNEETEKEQQLATWMIRYGKTHQSVSMEELKSIYPSAQKNQVDAFNHICFLIMEKEQMQWQCASQPEYCLGMAVAQARALLLIEQGHLCFKDAFKNEVFFGVYSQKELLKNPGKVEAACDHIEEMYTAYLQAKSLKQYLCFFKKNLENHDRLEPILTREQAHQDLKAVYGGESDTDDEGYVSDLSFG